MTTKNEKKRIKVAWTIMIAILVLTLIGEFFIHSHSVYGLEGTLFFNAWFGFASCAAIIIFSKFLGIFLKRNHDYYEDNK